jgi:glycosyltransferase involved in cell wall biosynthesis
MRVAIASSGLGHVNRGVEAWASDLAAALRDSGLHVTLFQAGHPHNDWTRAAWCLRRTGRIATAMGPLLRHLGAWRYGVGNDYEVEQLSFCLSLWPKIRTGFDILHVQDPTIALFFEALRRIGLSRPRVILGDGTQTPALILRRLSAVHHLSPIASAEWEPHRPPGQKNFTIPNFVDTDTFCPGDKRAARAALGLPTDALVVLCCAALRTTHKRIDYLIREFAALLDHYEGKALLVVGGGRESETEEVMRLGDALLGDRVRFLINHPRASMPDLYRAADLFVLTSLYELFGIVLIEAMAAGLPVVCHDAPIFRHVAGPAGMFGDIASDGSLARMLGELAAPARRAPLAAAARPHVERCFSAPVVVQQIRAMYNEVSEAGEMLRPTERAQPA